MFSSLLRYLRNVFKTAQERPLEASDLYETLDEHKSAPICDNFTKEWEQELSQQKPHLLRVINKLYGFRVLGMGFIFSVIETICRWVYYLISADIAQFPLNREREISQNP